MVVTRASLSTERVSKMSCIRFSQLINTAQKRTHKPTGIGGIVLITVNLASLVTTTTTIAPFPLDRRTSLRMALPEATISMGKLIAMALALVHLGNGCLECSQSHSTRAATIRISILSPTRTDHTRR